LNAADPANLFGGALGEAPRFARVPSTHVALVGGQLAAVFEDSGRRITAVAGTPPDQLDRAVQAYLTRPNASARVVVQEWNDVRVSQSPGQALLHKLGFQTTPTGLEWWASPASGR